MNFKQRRHLFFYLSLSLFLLFSFSLSIILYLFYAQRNDEENTTSYPRGLLVFYVSVSGRCPPPMFYYRHLDFCYTVGTMSNIDVPEIKRVCNSTGSVMATITSQNIQDYFSHFLTGRKITRVCLNGNVESTGNITLDDGSSMPYYNWAIGEPNYLDKERCFMMFGNSLWYNMECVRQNACLFVCETK